MLLGRLGNSYTLARNAQRKRRMGARGVTMDVWWS